MLLSLLTLCLNPKRSGDAPPVPREFRAVWVASVDHIDWPTKRATTTVGQKAELIKILDLAQNMKMNAVLLQIRPAADALYESSLEPWSVYLTGQQGRPPSPYYDPLAFAVAEAHKRGLELHAWFNPYRAALLSTKSPLSANSVARLHPDVVKRYGNLLWMDPGEPLVQRESRDVVEDVVQRYDIDGVHIDDYFYPYPEGGQDFPDDPSFRKYGGGLSRSEWRHKNVDDFIKGLYDGVHTLKPWVQVGISPFGIYRPGVPTGIKAGIDQYEQLYSDPVKWLQNGWCDYMAPQLYWPISQTAQSFPTLLHWWESVNTLHRHMWPGLYTSRTLQGETRVHFSSDEIMNQIRLIRHSTDDPGHIHFSMAAFVRDGSGVTEAVGGIAYKNAALPPPTPWLDPQAPDPPQLTVEPDGHCTWIPAPGKQPFWYVVQLRYGTRWLTRILSGETTELKVDPSLAVGRLNKVSLEAVSRCAIESQPAVATVE